MSAAAPARVGIFGGTFNPVHLGHLRAAEEVCEALELDHVRLVPSAQPPHKAHTNHDPIAPAELRLLWARKAVEDNPRLRVDPLEIERGGRSFTIDTVRHISESTGAAHPVFVIGWDAFALIDSWKDPEALLELAHFAVMTRPPAAEGALGEWIPKGLRPLFELDAGARRARHRRAETWIQAIEISALDISSSDVRARLRRGRSVRYLLPDPVRRAVEESAIFAPDRAILSRADG
jgi:nicotinate-nucleotide adenylyltransferase